MQLLLITAVCYYFVAWQVLALEEQLKREDIKREREGGRGRGGEKQGWRERERENESYSLIHYRVTYYTEFLPKKLRGACLVLIEVWWAIGSGLAALLALAVIPNGKIIIT